jgi:VWFA-related protein
MKSAANLSDSHIFSRLVLPVLLSIALATTVVAQSAQTPAAGSDTQVQVAPSDAPEFSQQEEAQSFKVKVNLVELRVVVRDKNGNALGNLTKDDFVVLDDKKPQPITRFAVEDNAIGNPAVPSSSAQSPQEGEIHSHLAGNWRVGYLIDDLNSTATDLTQARKASEQMIDSLAPGEMLAIFTLSGQGTQDFTADKALLRQAVQQLQPRPLNGGSPQCPPINYYLADQIQTNHDDRALAVVTTEATACQFQGHTSATAGTVARVAADRETRRGEAQNELALQTFNAVVRHLAVFPGQRSLVFMSPGFYVQREQAMLTDSLERTVRAGVIVSTLDLRGVLAPPTLGSDISQQASGSAYWAPDLLQYTTSFYTEQTDSLMQFANSTGGSIIHNTNDYAGGLAKLSAPPQYTYLLAFNPQGLNTDGKFHNLKVQLKQNSGYTVQARKGYYAPGHGQIGTEAKREIADAVFAQDQIHELPIRVQTQFFRSSEDSAKVNVLVHVDVRKMQFKKTDGRNLNELVVVAAVFDRNANLVNAQSNTVKMHIKDDTLASKLNSGITVKSSFEVNPGSYLVRVVARDEQGKMATQNDVVEIQ